MLGVLQEDPEHVIGNPNAIAVGRLADQPSNELGQDRRAEGGRLGRIGHGPRRG
jgi:hypothetical protein